jgi:hypothetical protein
MKPGTKRAQLRHDKLRAAGLRPIQIWVADTRAPGFAEEYERQCRVLAMTVDTDLDPWLDAANAELADDLDRHGL